MLVHPPIDGLRGAGGVGGREENLVPVVPQSEIRVKFLVCQSEKPGQKWRNFGEIFRRFSPFFSRENGRRKFHTNSSTHQDLKFHTP